MNDQVTAIIRTSVGAGVGSFAAWMLKTFAIDVDTATATNVLVPIVIGLVYSAIHLLETKVDRRFGWLLGIAKRPVYVDTKP